MLSAPKRLAGGKFCGRPLVDAFEIDSAHSMMIERGWLKNSSNSTFDYRRLDCTDGHSNSTAKAESIAPT
jgi:hypothetical protein